MATPANKVKLVKLRKADQSITKATPKNGARNFSFLNTTIKRQTLRANNRALAQSLARMKLELRRERDTNMEMKSELQELHLGVNRLKRLVGMKDEQIDEEVKKRMKEQFSAMCDLVEQAVGSIFNAGKSLGELQDKCTSIMTSTDRNSTGEPNQLRPSLNEKKGKSGEDGRSKNLFDGLPQLPVTMTMPPHTDISMIAEQSILGDPGEVDLAEPSSIQPDKKSRRDTGTIPKKIPVKKVSKMPQRVPRQPKYQPPDFSKPRTADIIEPKEKLDQATSNNQDPFKPSQALHRSPVKRAASDSADPFKPTKVLLRSPLARDMMGQSVTEESPPEKIDSREFFASLTNNLDMGILDEQMPGSNFGEENTMFFNSDMELTSVIDMSKLVPPSGKSPNLPMAQVVESSENAVKNTLTVPKAKSSKTAIKPPNDKQGNPAAKSVDPSTDQADSGATVELKNLKPGVFTFSVSRKEADGSRKPVPEKKPTARSKKKPKVVAKEDEPPKPVEDRDLFSFGDRTPTVPLEKLVKPTQKPPSTVYDVSMNESAIAPQTSLNTFREKMKEKDKNDKTDKQSSVEAIEEKKQEPDNVYYLPLKGCSDDLPTEKQSRGRSRSKKRHSSSDDEDWVPGQRAKSRSRAKKRLSSEADNTEDKDKSQASARKRSKSSTEQCSPEKPTRQSARSKSRSRKSANSDDEFEQPTRSKSRSRKAADSDNEVEQPKRSKSRSRKPADSDDEAEQPTRSKSRSRKPVESNNAVERPTRSKSRSRKSNDSDNEIELPTGSKSQDSDNEVEVPTMSKSRSRKPADLDNAVELPKRSKSRSRKAVDSNNAVEQPTRSKSRTRKVSDSDSEVDVPKNSKSRSRKLSDSDNEDELPKRSKSRSRKPADSDNAVQQPTRSKSRSRKAADSDNEAEQPTMSKSETCKTADSDNDVEQPRKSKPIQRIHSDDQKEENSAILTNTEDISRSHSRSNLASDRVSARSKSRQINLPDTDDDGSPAKETSDDREAKSHAGSKQLLDKPHEQVRPSARSRSRVRNSEDESPRKETPGRKSRGKSGSNFQEQPDKDKVSGRRSARSRSRARLPLTDTNKQAEEHVDTNQKSDISETVKTDSCDLTKTTSSTANKEREMAESDQHIYQLPLKDSPPVTKKPKSSRSRSRSRLKVSDSEESPEKQIRSERRTAHIEPEDKEDAAFEQLISKVSVRSKGRRKKTASAKQGKESGDSGLVLPDFIVSCDSPVNQTGDGDNQESDSENKQSLKKQELLANMAYHVISIQELTPKMGIEESTSNKTVEKSDHLDKVTKTGGKSVKRQKVDTKISRSKRKSVRDSPDKDEIQTEEIDKKVSVRSKSSKKKLANVEDPKNSKNAGLVLPEFVLSPDLEPDCPEESVIFVSEEKNNMRSSLKGEKVLKEVDFNTNDEGESDNTKKSSKKVDRRKLSSKTPKTEQQDFKVPTTKSVKTKSTRKAKPVSSKKAEKEALFVADTPKGENSRDSDHSAAKVSRKRLDHVYVKPEEAKEKLERSPASANKRSKKKSGEECTASRTSDRGVLNDENEKPLNNLAKIKQKLSMISSKPRQSVVEIDDESFDGHHGSEGDPTPSEIDEDQAGRTRRNRPEISYCPKPLNVKMRRGDEMFDKKKMSKENAEKVRLLLGTKKMP